MKNESIDNPKLSDKPDAENPDRIVIADRIVGPADTAEVAAWAKDVRQFEIADIHAEIDDPLPIYQPDKPSGDGAVEDNTEAGSLVQPESDSSGDGAVEDNTEAGSLVQPESDSTVGLDIDPAVGRLGPRARNLIETSPPPDKPSEQAAASEAIYIQRRVPCPDSYSQRVSDSARAAGVGHYSAGERPLKPDSGKLEVAASHVIAARAAAIDRDHGESADGTASRPKAIAEVGADTGLRMYGILEALKRDHPAQYEQVQARIITNTEHDRDAMRASGLFDKFGTKVTIEATGPDGPRLDENTVFALVSNAPQMPVHRLAKMGPTDPYPSEVFEATSYTYVTQRHIVTAGTTPLGGHTAQVVDVGYFPTLGTADVAGARDEYAPQLEAHEALKGIPKSHRPGEPLVSEKLLDSDETIAEFMKDWPKHMGLVKHYSPALTNIIGQVTAQLDPKYGQLVIEGRIRSGEKPLNGAMTMTSGLVVDHVIEADTIRAGVAAGGRSADNLFLTQPEPRTDYHGYGYVDLANQPSLVSSAKASFKKELLDRGQPEQAHLRSAEADLAGERNEEDIGSTSAVESVLERYDEFLTANPQAAYNSDLALQLSRLLNEHGHYEAAVVVADGAIGMAPHVNAAARVEKATALTWLGIRLGIPSEDAGTAEEVFAQAEEVFAQARAELDAAQTISPQLATVDRARASLALAQGNYADYTQALADEQNHAAMNDPARVVRAWQAISFGQVVGSLQSVDHHRPTIAIERWPNHPDGQIWRPEIEVVDPNDTTPEKLAAIDTLRSAAVGLHHYLTAVEPERGQWRQRALTETLDLGKTVMAAEEYQAALERFESGLVFVGAAADQLIADAAQASNVSDVPDSTIGSEVARRLFDGVSIGDVNDKDTGKRVGSFVLTPEALNTHVLITGVPGSGKTTTDKAILVNLAKAGIPATVIDMGDRAQFRDLPELLHGISPVVWLEPGNERAAAFSLGLLVPEPGFSPQKHIDLVRQVLAMSNAGHEPWPQLVKATLQDSMADRGWDVGRRSDGTVNTRVSRTPDVLTMADFRASLLRHIERTGYGDRMTADIRGFAKVRADDLSSGWLGELLDSEYPLDMHAAQQQTLVMSLHQVLSTEDRKLIVALMLAKDYERLSIAHEQRGGDTTLEGITLASEAHHVFGVADHNDPAQVQVARFGARLVSQLRGLGRGMIYDTQLPQLLIPEMAQEASTTITMRSPSEESRRTGLGNMGIRPDDDAFTSAVNLAVGEAVAFRSGEDDAPQPVRIHPESTTLPNGSIPRQNPPIINVYGQHNAGRADPPSPVELRGAQVALAQPEHAPLVVMANLVTLARESHNEYPKPFTEVQDWYGHASERERSMMLSAAAKQAARLRADAHWGRNSTAQLTAAVRLDMERLLQGIPLAGSKPGREFVVPELMGAQATQDLTNPLLYNEPPSDRAVVLDDNGYATSTQTGSRPNYHTARAGEVKVALQRDASTMLSGNGNAVHAAENESRAWTALLGSDDGKVLAQAIATMTHHEPDSVARWLDIATRAGLYKPGDTGMPWVAKLFSLARRTIGTDK